MAQQRLDKIIASTGRYSRREVKTLVREGRVLVDGRIAASALAFVAMMSIGAMAQTAQQVLEKKAVNTVMPHRRSRVMPKETVSGRISLKARPFRRDT